MDGTADDDRREDSSPLEADAGTAVGANSGDSGLEDAPKPSGDEGVGSAPKDEAEEGQEEDEDAALARMMAFQEEQHEDIPAVGAPSDAPAAEAVDAGELAQDDVDGAQDVAADPNVAFLGPDPAEEEDDDDAPHPNLDNPAAIALRRRQALQDEARRNPEAHAAWRDAPYPVRKLMSFLRPRLRYTNLSLLAAGLLLHHTLRTRQQFYLALVYLQSSKLAYILLGNAVIALAVSAFGVITRLFLDGGLRPNERDAIGEHIRWDVTETCLALTIFRSELDVITAVQFMGLVVMKCLHWSVELRGGHLRMTEEAFAYPGEDDDLAVAQAAADRAKKAWYHRVPRLRLTHIRYYFLVQILLMLDILGVAHCALSVATHGPSVDILFGFESAILLVSGLSSAGMYNLHVIDGVMGVFHHLAEGGHHHVPVGGMAEPNANDLLEASGDGDEQQQEQDGDASAQQDAAVERPQTENTNKFVKVLVERLANPWRDRRATLSFAIELQAQAAKFLFYVVFFAIVFTYYGMPINIFREVYVSFQQLRRRLVAFNTYRRLTHNMDKRFESISDEEELDRLGRTCIICRDAMDLSGGCKRLPGCGHAFHAHCLREWLVQQQTCPTCRADIAKNELKEKKRKERERAAEAAAAALVAEYAPATADSANSDAAADSTERPTAESQMPVGTSSQNQREIQQEEIERREIQRAIAIAEGAGSAGSEQRTAAPLTTAPAENNAELPPGWTSHVDAGSRRTYYYNQELGQSTWDTPSPQSAGAQQPTTGNAGPNTAAVSNSNAYTMVPSRSYNNPDRMSEPPTQPRPAPGFPCLYRITAPTGAPVFSPSLSPNGPHRYIRGFGRLPASLFHHGQYSQSRWARAILDADANDGVFPDALAREGMQDRTIPCGKLIVGTTIEYWPLPFEEAMLRMPDGYVRCQDVQRFVSLSAQGDGGVAEASQETLGMVQ